MKIYFKVILIETGKKAYVCANDISSVEGAGSGCLWVRLKDGKTYFVKDMEYVPEATVDMQDLIKLEGTESPKVVPAEIIEEVKQKNGMVSIDVIKDYLSTRAINGLHRGGCTEFYCILSAIEDMRMFRWRDMGKKTVQEIIDLFLQMDLIERKTDRVYKPCEGYVRKAPLYIEEEKAEEEDEEIITGEMYSPKEALSVYRSIMEAGGVIWDPKIKKSGWKTNGDIYLVKGRTEKQANKDIDFFADKSWEDKSYTRYYMEITGSDEEVIYVNAWCK